MKKVIYSLAACAFLLSGAILANTTFLNKDKEVKFYSLGGSEREPGILSIKDTL